MNPTFIRRWLLLAGVVLQVLAQAAAHAEVLRTQTLQLQRGWNAVFLEVHPVNAEPTAVFANTPVDIAAAYFAPSSPAQFMTDPGVDLFKQAGWGVWYAGDRPDAFLTSLHAIEGQHAYLVHCAADHLWQITGDVVPPRVRWQPNAYNFVGFSLGAHPGTFGQFFGGSTAHRHNRIYRLLNGSWRRVNDATAETMRSGEGFWIYCEGRSDYQGPLRVSASTSVGVLLGGQSDAVALRNETDHPITPTVEHVVCGPHPVPLSIVIRAIGSTNVPMSTIPVAQPDGNWTQLLPPIDGGHGLQVPLEARLTAMGAARHASLLKISTDLGTEVWLPILAHREDLDE